MSDIQEHVAEQISEQPAFEAELREAEAELELALGISRLRQTRGLSQRRLAALAGMPQSSVGRYELAGRAPSVGSLWRLATALDATFILGPRFFARVIGSPPAQVIGPLAVRATHTNSLRSWQPSAISSRTPARRVSAASMQFQGNAEATEDLSPAA